MNTPAVAMARTGLGGGIATVPDRRDGFPVRSHPAHAEWLRLTRKRMFNAVRAP